MNLYRYILRNLRYYRSAHLWIVSGSLMCTAILVGALVVGDSVRYSLQQLVTVRLGRTRFAVSSGDRFFRTALAEALSGRLETTVAPILQVKGIAVADGGRERVNRVSVVGVDGRFGDVGGARGIYGELSNNEVVVNRSLASQLRLEAGDRLLLRLEALDAMPRDAPLASAEDQTVARRFVIKAVVGPADFGDFRLQNNQVAPGTAFVALSALARHLDLADRANGLLVAERRSSPPPWPT